MKLSCKIIQDLLLLYTDDACSQESRIAVEEHLAHCPACRRHMEALKLPEAMAEPIPEPVIQERVRVRFLQLGTVQSVPIRTQSSLQI